MYKNGISHLTASSNLEGVTHILQWLSYVPESKGDSLPVRETSDYWDRDIAFTPPTAKKMNTHRSGSLASSTKGVLPGDTRQAGQVWYPNSAYKTAQAIFDSIVKDSLSSVANWCGFSGGQEDMYDEVLKQGSKIVDGLSAYKQPVFIYIVPNGELCGGAWVILGPLINPEKMQMYADVEAHAGVLEPEGIVEIKMRQDKILTLMERLDSTYAELKHASKHTTKTPEERAQATEALANREVFLQPTYKYFYWALRVRIARSGLLEQIEDGNPEMESEERTALLDSLIPDSGLSNNCALAEVPEQLDITPTLSKLKADHLLSHFAEVAGEDRKASLDGLVRIIDSLSNGEKMSLQSAIQNSVCLVGPPGKRLDSDYRIAPECQRESYEFHVSAEIITEENGCVVLLWLKKMEHLDMYDSSESALVAVALCRLLFKTHKKHDVLSLGQVHWRSSPQAGDSSKTLAALLSGTPIVT
ncbi:ClpP/crotonase-like domain-containing protein [Suillus placidus]|uniref:ClpP/crotonase-like domain-containing protein n=1 Tax=Suillus placidus TaxID=48579 RepID=A0A9P7D1M8_9AGAM|nr:ClpP/crotonase-like domain-containing protein [Suillus placidus]